MLALALSPLFARDFVRGVRCASVYGAREGVFLRAPRPGERARARLYTGTREDIYVCRGDGFKRIGCCGSGVMRCVLFFVGNAACADVDLVRGGCVIIARVVVILARMVFTGWRWRKYCLQGK